jgi:hypothetical protein
MLFETFSVLPYIVASLAFFIVGSLWYMPLFGRAWSKEVGAGDGSQGGSMALPMIGQVVSSFVFALGVYAVVSLGKIADFGGSLLVTLALGLLVGFSVNSGKLLFQNKPKLFFIDSCYNLVGTFVVALILSLWK